MRVATRTVPIFDKLTGAQGACTGVTRTVTVYDSYLKIKINFTQDLYKFRLSHYGQYNSANYSQSSETIMYEAYNVTSGTSTTKYLYITDIPDYDAYSYSTTVLFRAYPESEYDSDYGGTSVYMSTDTEYTHTLHYNANGGSGAPSSQSSDWSTSSSTTFTISTVIPNRNGYKFIGWSTSSTATSATYSPGDSIILRNGVDQTLYAIWEEKSLLKIKVDNTWVESQMIYVKVDGAWHQEDALYIKVDGEWKKPS